MVGLIFISKFILSILLVDKHAHIKKCSEECGEKDSDVSVIYGSNSNDVETRKKQCETLNDLSSVHRSATPWIYCRNTKCNHGSLAGSPGLTNSLSEHS